MSNDDQMMMNQAHGLTPDDGHDEDLIARRQEDLAKEMYDFLGEISEKIQTFNTNMKRSTSSGQPPVVPMINCGTQGWLGKESSISTQRQVEMLLYLACIIRSGTCSRR